MSERGQGPPQDPGQIRAFVAVELPDDIKQMLSDVEILLKRRMTNLLGSKWAERSLKWVSPESVHITLKFLGYVAPERIVAIEEALRRVAENQRAFTLALDGLGVFPSFTKPRVIWVGVKGDLERLASLQTQVEVALANLGFPGEKRPFSPHLTLARVRETASIGELRLIGQAVKEPPPVSIDGRAVPVRRVSLMRSELSRHGARYTCLAEFPLLS